MSCVCLVYVMCHVYVLCMSCVMCMSSTKLFGFIGIICIKLELFELSCYTPFGQLQTITPEALPKN